MSTILVVDGTVAASSSIDLILLDLAVPGLDGLHVLNRLKSFAESSETPVIVYSSCDQDDEVIKALDLGANDFVSKSSNFPVLAARIRTALRLKSLDSELKQANAKLRRIATIDQLSNLYNRSHFFNLTNAEFSKSQRYHRPMSIIMLDVDKFKIINDTYGHAAGDKVLVKLAGTCRAAVRNSDIVGRLGGEEFAICCPDSDLLGAHAIAERIRNDCESASIEYNGKQIQFTVSLGITSQSPNDRSFENTLNRADKLLYEAKNKGRNCSVAC